MTTMTSELSELEQEVSWKKWFDDEFPSLITKVIVPPVVEIDIPSDSNNVDRDGSSFPEWTKGVDVKPALVEIDLAVLKELAKQNDVTHQNKQRVGGSFDKL